MTGLPTVRVDLDDGSGSFPYNISDYVDLAKGVTIKRGRPDQFANVEASELNLWLKNDDGRFTRGSVTYNVFIDQRIKVTETVGATTSVRFTGYVSAWPVSWEGGPAKAAATRVQAFDRFPMLQRKIMGLQVVESIRTLGPVVYYPLNEPATALAASNIASPVYASPLTPQGLGAAVVFAGAVGVGTDPDPVAAQWPAARSAYLGVTQVPATVALTGITMFTALLSATPPAAAITLFSIDGYALTMDATGKIGAACPGGTFPGVSANVADGTSHLVMLRYDGATLEVLIDGVSVYSTAAVAALTSVTISSIALAPPGVLNTAFYTGALSHAAVIPTKISNPQAVALWSAMKDGGVSETSAARFTRLALYGGVAATDVVTETPLLTALPAQDVVNQNPLPALQTVATAEGGLAFIRGDGKLVLQTRYHRAQQVTADLSITTDDLTSDLEVEYDMDEVTNYATGTRANVVTDADTPAMLSQSATSIATHGQYPMTLDALLVTTDQEVQDRTDWIVNRYAEPFPRLPDAKIDLLTSTSATQQAALNLELSDRLSIGTLPSQAPNMGDLIVEGWTETIKSGSGAEWSLSVNASPFSVVAAFTPDHAIYGIPDSPLAPVMF